MVDEVYRVDEVDRSGNVGEVYEIDRVDVTCINLINFINLINLKILLTQAEFLDQRTVFVNVFLRVIRQQALALAYHGEQGTAGGVVFFVGAKVCRQAFDAVREQRDLRFGVTGVLFVAAVLLYDLGDFFFAVIDCHFLCNDE